MGLICGKYILEKLDEALRHYISRLESFERELSMGSSLEAPYLITLGSDISALRTVLSASGYDKKRDAMLSLSFATIQRAKNKTPLMEDFAEYRNIMKKDISTASLQPT